MGICISSSDDFDAYAEVTIHHKVDALIGRYGYLEQDREDLEQDLRLWVLERLAAFAPREVQRSTYISRIVDQRIADLIKTKLRARRDPRREACVLDEHDEPTNDLDTLPGHASVSSRIQDLRIDMGPALARLNARQRAICLMLASESKEAAKLSLDLSRRTFEKDLQVIRDAFQQAGLNAYLN